MSEPFFTGVPERIPFGGPDSADPLAFTVYEPDLARRILGYPPDHDCEQLLAFGYPANPDDLTRPLRPGKRRPLDDVVHRGRW